MLTVTPLRCPTAETAAMTGMKCHHRGKQSQRDKVSEGGERWHAVRGKHRARYAVILYRASCSRHSWASDIVTTVQLKPQTGAKEGETPSKKYENQTKRTTSRTHAYVFFFPISSWRSFYLICPWQTAGRPNTAENSVMTDKSGRSMKSQNLAVTSINRCGHSG